MSQYPFPETQAIPRRIPLEDRVMPDLADGESVEMQGSGSKPYVLKNTGGVYSCTCPAWRNQSIGIERRTCKHLRKLRGDAAEETRVGEALPAKPAAPTGESTAPPLLLAESWDGAADPTGWLMSEKLDGVRAYWDGKQFVSRQGNLYHAPEWFVAGLPTVPLDGELWLGRKAFQRTVSIVRRQDRSDHWKEIRFVVFDAPSLEKRFEDRLTFVRECIGPSSKYAQSHEHVACLGIDHLRQELARLEALGAEGVMLRRPGSRYENGRSSTLLKVKSFFDREARVIEHQAGAGRHKGRLGALLVELDDGTRFAVGTGFTDAEREKPPALGSLITFRYQELSDRGVPRFPSFVGVREEAKDLPKPNAKAAPPKSTVALSAKPATGSTSASGAARRFEFREDGSEKFWEISRSGGDVTVRFGRIGTNGQTQTKSFADEASAVKHADKLIAEKTAKGYVEAP
jgi:DNA ligase-1